MSPSGLPPAEQIERLQRRRTGLLAFQFVIFALWQITFFALPEHSSNAIRAVDHVKIGAYIVWAVLLLLFLGTGGGYLYPKTVRQVLNDESTVAHRARATAVGFYAALSAAIGCYVVTMFEPMSGREAAHYILTVGIGVALMSFVVLEQRAQPHG